MNHSRCIKAYAVLLAICLSASTLSAQATINELRIKLEGTPGVGISGALVALLDEKDRVVAEGLSNPSGMRLFHPAIGKYTIQVRRIGFQPFRSDSILSRAVAPLCSLSRACLCSSDVSSSPGRPDAGASSAMLWRSPPSGKK